MKTWPLYCFCNVEPLFPLLHFGSHPQSVSVPSGSRLARVLLVLTTTLKSSCSSPRSVMEQRRPRHATAQPNPISDSRHAGLLPPWRWSSLQHNKQKTSVGTCSSWSFLCTPPPSVLARGEGRSSDSVHTSAVILHRKSAVRGEEQAVCSTLCLVN